jgi:hypothetical protein
VSAFDDYQDVTRSTDDLLVSGQAVPEEGELVALIAALRRAAEAPAPRPTPALSAVLRDGLDLAPSRSSLAAVTAPTKRPRVRRVLRYVAGLSLAAKIALGAGVAVAAVTGAATVDSVPAVVRVPARAVVSVVVDLFATGSPAPADPVQGPAATRAPGTGTGTGEPGTTAGVGIPGTSPSERPSIPNPAESSPLTGTPADPGVRVPTGLGTGRPITPRDLGRQLTPGRSGGGPVVPIIPAPQLVPSSVVPPAAVLPPWNPIG